jgi:hypothetical protein
MACAAIKPIYNGNCSQRLAKMRLGRLRALGAGFLEGLADMG